MMNSRTEVQDSETPKQEDYFMNELKSVIDANPYGHLELKYRVSLMQKISSADITNKIFLECVKFVLPIWKLDNSEDINFEILLQAIQEYLYDGKGSKEHIEELQNKFRNYFENVSDTKSGLPGLSIISLSGGIIGEAAQILDIDDYEGQDDNSFDWDVWNPDFCASIAYAGGNPFVDEGDVAKRKCFWNWYLDIVDKLKNESDNPVLPFKYTDATESETTEIFTRTQTFQTNEIIDKIRRVIELCRNDLDNSMESAQWIKIELVGECLEGGLAMRGFYFDNEEEKNEIDLKYYLYDDDDSAVDVMDGIKNLMYEQSPKEGAWFGYIISVNKNSDFSINFNYDNMSALSDIWQKPDIFSEEFETYPRSIDFTPEWLQSIVVKYKS